jgi:hypothetical protein
MDQEPVEGKKQEHKMTQAEKEECRKSKRIVVFLGFYLAIFVVLALQGMLQLWSLPAFKEPNIVHEKEIVTTLHMSQVPPKGAALDASESKKEEPSSAKTDEKKVEYNEFWKIKLFFFIPLTISAEMRLLLIVIFSGALGALAHAVRSLVLFVGNNNFCASWTLNYLLRPFLGSLLGTLFYLLVRGGFFSPNAGVEGTSQFGMSALAGLVGLFSDTAMAKLKKVSIAIFTEPEKANDPIKVKSEKQNGATPNCGQVSTESGDLAGSTPSDTGAVAPNQAT